MSRYSGKSVFEVYVHVSSCKILPTGMQSHSWEGNNFEDAIKFDFSRMNTCSESFNGFMKLDVIS